MPEGLAAWYLAVPDHPKGKTPTETPSRIKTQKEDPEKQEVCWDIQGNPSGLHSRTLTQVGQGGRGQLTERTNHRAAHVKVRVMQAKKASGRAKCGG